MTVSTLGLKGGLNNLSVSHILSKDDDSCSFIVNYVCIFIHSLVCTQPPGLQPNWPCWQPHTIRPQSNDFTNTLNSSAVSQHHLLFV